MTMLLADRPQRASLRIDPNCLSAFVFGLLGLTLSLGLLMANPEALAALLVN
jgi:hypothetical protein